ncbi:uncharacterized protein HMPREF1541_02643 [Cyphellophora europaea CBS 101466]|uniref:Bromo domain-containing protein n=1 Tax=Cyphellophora europaea (strain CBS 101466) TaxID=1220924 RepID=W2S6D4_CYPE1|nr:uncharacterized protein HMPREF1541_02643 [Cyphellophora europaea CBS 101466]ETN43484.1 hypothetical protein HMPREF1541_02643 [Cyphellophora europaea CBS 101466]
MPSLTSYTSFETLKLCQSIAQYGTDAAAFNDIAAALNANDLIRESESYDGTRLTAAALQNLYDELIRQESGGSPKINGDASLSNSRKRKLSASPRPDGESQEEMIHLLVEKLYARFREEAVKEIKRDEDEYLQLQEEIQELEKQSQLDATENNLAQAQKPSEPDAVTQPTPVQGAAPRVQDGPVHGQPSVQQHPHPAQTQHSQAEGHAPPQTAPSTQQQHHSPGPYNRAIPPPSSRQPYPPPPVPHQHGYGQASQGHPQMMAYSPGVHQMPPPTEYGSRKGSSSASTPARGSPAPGHQQQYPPYQQPYHQPPPQWQHPYPPSNAYTAHMQYPNQPYYVQSPGGRQHPHFQTPHPTSYQAYPQTAPVSYHQPPHGWQPSPGHSPYPQPHSAATTPVPNMQRRNIVRMPGSSTPWKRRPLPPNTMRPPSPTRPERSVSPVSESEGVVFTPAASTHSAHTPLKDSVPKREQIGARRGRPPSVAASRRSQSVASPASETPVIDKTDSRKPATIKTEAPSTPLPEPTPSDSVMANADARSSGGRRGRGRNNTVTSRPDTSNPLNVAGTNKRKRSSPSQGSPMPSTSRVTGHHNHFYPSHPHLVLVSKNFTKTTQIMLNDIISHKLAGVFAKPLSERDAPGYKDLVLRPQDLKGIKTAVGRGGRAAVAAIEVLEAEHGEGLESAIVTETGEEKEGMVGSGVFLVRKTEDLVPPKGIVNAAQLETELIRVFANAIMFNPLPASERGFGRNLRLRKRGGDVVSKERDSEERAAASVENEDAEPTSSDEDESESESEVDTGIITDAREMFEDVYGQVQRWREVERDSRRGDTSTMGGVSEGDTSGKARQGSVVSALAEEVSASTPTTSVKEGLGAEEGRGTLRKRRKIAE